ncbi:hypothetical protein [Pseudomonas putida]|uniref:hypothetical protein n=1 Tax=Pseudomonas putida TaxID=303 RepID=UPI000D3CB68F|nr:hypothetical protein [Pseudomonas putida]PTV65601.1 hypothetical protein DBL03_03400 [Pseudomonas putida]
MSHVYPNHEPISLNNQRIPAFLRFMKSKEAIVSVPKANPPLPIGNCYWNVDAMVEREGGEAIYGWDITIWSKSHISAMHHAVWRRPDGTLLDVTDTYPNVKNRTTSSFLPDERIQIDLRKQPNIPAKHFIFNDRDATAEFVDACEQLHLIDQQLAAIVYEAGYRCESQFATARGLPAATTFEMSLSPASAAQYSYLSSRKPAALERIGNAIVSLQRVT